MSKTIFGGTFDPIHYGHLLIAEQAYNKFKLDEIIFMPAGFPPHKDFNYISKGEDRLELLKRAIADNPHFSYSKLEMKQDRISYTVDTLREFKKQGTDQVQFIIGADSLLDIPNWKEPEYLLTNAHIIVAQRPSISIKKVLERDFYKKYLSNIHILDCPLLDISSSELRRYVREQKSIKYMTPEPVIKYIRKKGLYQ